jgi:GcrA cell cycle regulator
MTGWTEERVELLKELWSEGLSASQVAERLGGLARNAVIGKVHRLCLATPPGREYRMAGHGQPRGRRRVPAGTPRAIRLRPRIAPAALVAAVPASAIKPAAAVVEDPQIHIEELPGVALLDLRAEQCRFPYGDPKRDFRGFCGRDASGSFCPHHSRIVYRPAARVRR